MNKLNKTLPVAALLGLCALIFFLRLHTYEEPLERDATIYAVIAHEMLNGKTLYTDLWDHKPPAIYVTYAAAELIAGYGARFDLPTEHRCCVRSSSWLLLRRLGIGWWTNGRICRGGALGARVG